MSPRPLAYHITFGTYGTRLHGDDRGTVSRGQNGQEDLLLGRDEQLESYERGRMSFPPVELTPEQMRHGEEVIPSICERGGWSLLAWAVGPDHVHVVLHADADGLAVRKWFKRWLGEQLSNRWSLPDGATWWAEGGSVKHIWDDAYLVNATDYVHGQRAMTER